MLNLIIIKNEQGGGAQKIKNRMCSKKKQDFFAEEGIKDLNILFSEE
jgi:hypothetical protein